MATTYTSTIEINVWKEHTCLACGQQFRYLFKRTKKGTGGTEAAASQAANAAVMKALRSEVDMRPCPACGLYQPDMVASRRALYHWIFFGVAAAALALIIILALAEAVSCYTLTWIAVGIGAVIGLSHFLVDLRNPNRDLESNRNLAQAHVQKGDLWVGTPGPGGEGENPGGGWTGAHTIAYALLGVAVLTLAIPGLLRTANGWPLNEKTYPEVMGPGDEVKVYVPNKITSVKGYWQGHAQAVIVNGPELGVANLPPLKATSNDSKWDQKISISSKESKESSPTLWAKVQLPSNPELAGKKVQVLVKLQVLYPKLTGPERFDETMAEFTHNATLQLGSPMAGSTYRSAWWWGTLTGIFLILFLSFWLARLADSFKHKALPTSIFVPGQEPEKEEEEPPVAELAPEEPDGGQIKPAGE
jgi:hypothetical protein